MRFMAPSLNTCITMLHAAGPHHGKGVVRVKFMFILDSHLFLNLVLSDDQTLGYN